MVGIVTGMSRHIRSTDSASWDLAGRVQNVAGLLAAAATGKTILDRVARLSEALVTHIEQRDGRGMVHVK